jgi:hypothetical protein
MDFTASIDQLDANRGIIIALLDGMSQAEASWRPVKGRWTILEMINHLNDIEREDFRTDLRLILETPDKPWPRFSIEKWRIERKYNERDLLKSAREFAAERAKSVKWLKSLGKPDLNSVHSGSGGPKGRKMKAGDVIASWIAHDLYHIRQVTLAKWYILNESSAPFSPAYSGFRI